MYIQAVKKISGNGYDELIMVVGGKKSFFILSLYGEIDLKKISKLSKSMNIKGMEHLRKLDDN